MNFIFISPDFPEIYYKFCTELKNRGVTVLGISQTPYDALRKELKESLTEYYRVNNMESYEEMYKAVAFFSFKYGKIDYIESNNEYWLELDSKLREDFNINTGKKYSDMAPFKSKEAMKKYYKKAGVKTARFHISKDLAGDLSFIKKVGYPIIAKPDNGVGAQKTYKIKSLDDLKKFYETKDNRKYIMEEFIEGELISFDGIVDSSSNPVFSSYEVFPKQAIDIVNDLEDDFYYASPYMPDDLKEIGERVLKSFGAKKRWFHLEFFRLTSDHKYLGKKGTIIGLEVNMRAPGGNTPDMINWANSVDTFKIWADTIVYDKTNENLNLNKYYCVTCGRRDFKHYIHNDEDIKNEFKEHILDHRRMPKILSDDMGDDCWYARFDTIEDVYKFMEYLKGTTD